MNLVNIGFGNLVNADRVISIVSPESAPVKRIVQDAKSNGVLIDATHGRKTMSVIVIYRKLPKNSVRRLIHNEKNGHDSYPFRSERVR